jgi:hypothetical protein
VLEADSKGKSPRSGAIQPFSAVMAFGHIVDEGRNRYPQETGVLEHAISSAVPVPGQRRSYVST